jgi:hypothetical protein
MHLSSMQPFSLQSLLNMASQLQPSKPVTAPTAMFSDLLRLPDETLLQVIQKLGTDELLQCRQTCRRLRYLTLDRSLDFKLFRGGIVVPIRGVLDFTEVRVHPLLKMTNLLNTDIKDCYVSNANGRDSGLITSYTGRNEMATSPAMTKITLSVGNSRVHHVQCRTGVTVIHLIKAVCRILNKTSKRDVKRSTAQPWLFETKPGVPAILCQNDNRLAKNIECLGQYPRWNGFWVIEQHGSSQIRLRSKEMHTPGKPISYRRFFC